MSEATTTTVTRKPRAASVNAMTFITVLAKENPNGELTQAQAREYFKNADGTIMEKGTFDGKLVMARKMAKAANDANPEKCPMPKCLEFKHAGGSGGNGRVKGGSMSAALATLWATGGEEIDGIGNDNESAE